MVVIFPADASFVPPRTIVINVTVRIVHVKCPWFILMLVPCACFAPALRYCARYSLDQYDDLHHRLLFAVPHCDPSLPADYLYRWSVVDDKSIVSITMLVVNATNKSYRWNWTEPKIIQSTSISGNGAENLNVCLTLTPLPSRTFKRNTSDSSFYDKLSGRSVTDRSLWKYVGWRNITQRNATQRW